MKKKLKMTLIIFASISVLALIFVAIIFSQYLAITKNETFDKTKLATSSFQIELYDADNNLITDKNKYNNQHINLQTLNDYTKNAFIAIEDKDFYNHNGVNYKRIAKAMLTNFKNGKIKEGASTISQQLIKNTHLSNEKTYKRKIKEIFLTKEMEKQISKDEILESYLNVIYFGNNIYGIENASRFYFKKPASDLNLEESAMLAGIIKSPGYYCPISKKENCLARRNLVLSEMLKDEYISQEEYEKSKNSELILNIDNNFDNGQNSYSQGAIDEACKILSLPTKQIALGGYKIFTYQNKEKQNNLEKAIKNQFSNISENDIAGISINNTTLGIEAYFGKSTFSILSSKRQPGSTIKPLLVYGPAMNENLIAPATMILDDEININGYSPKNVSNTYSGYVSIRDAVAKSINIPAVKTLSYIGIDKAKLYAKRLNLEFDDKDDGYALALGGMTYGINLKSLTNAYTTFANNGKFQKAAFIREIRDKNDKIIYKNEQSKDQVLREDANYLTLSTLFDTVKYGTAKRLNSLPYQIASKTGTVGKNENSDAYNISLTSQDTVGVWIGNLKHNNIGNITGGVQPSDVVKDYFKLIYSNSSPKDFDIPTSVAEIEIDALELENNHIIVKANDFIPERYKKTELFSKFNLPKEMSTNFLEIEPAQLKGKVVNNNITLEFDSKNYLIYDLYKIENGKNKLIKSYNGVNGIITYTAPFEKEKIEKFFLKTRIKNHATGEEIESEPSQTIELINTTITPTKSQKRNWYI